MKRNILVFFLVIQFFNGLSQTTIFYSDTINFEKPCDYLYIDSSSTNLWQIGIPDKTIFDSAYSKPYAMITDTINNYTLNNHSNFIVKLEPESIEFNGNTIINFWHKFDTDSINDLVQSRFPMMKGMTGKYYIRIQHLIFITIGVDQNRATIQQRVNQMDG